MKSACSWPGCPEVIETGARFCPQHWSQHYSNQYRRRGGTTAERGYGGRWQRIRKRVLARESLCRECMRQGYVVGAEVVHHIDGDTRNVMWSNLEPLCKRCHDRLTMGELWG